MVLRGRTLYIPEYSSTRETSVPAASYHVRRVQEFTDDFDSDVEPQLLNRTSKVFFDDNDDLMFSAPKLFERDLPRSFNSKVYFSSVHPPSPIIMDSTFSFPTVENTTYSVPYTSYSGHIPRARVPFHYDYNSSARTLPSYQYPRSYSTDARRRTLVGGIRPLVKRHSAMDDEVEAFLASSPQSRYTPSFRSMSTPGVSHYSSTYTGTPSYASQHLYRPPTWTPSSSGWTSHNSYSGHSGYQPSYLLTTRVAPPSPSRVPPTVYAPFVSSVYRPLTNYAPRSVARSPSVARRPLSRAGSSYRHATPVVHPIISSDLTYSSKPPVSTYGSTNKLYGDDVHLSPSNLRSGRSRSRFSEAPPSPQFARKPRSSSVAVDAPRPIVNYKDVKAPMSDTRRKVRDLICKTRNDPNYYK